MKRQNIKEIMIEHEDKYIHIPKVNLYPLIGLIIFGLLAFGNFKLIDMNVVSISFGNDTQAQSNLQTKDLINIYPIIGEYLLIGLFVLSFFALIKGGYNKLKGFDEGGLIFGLIFGFTGGLIFGFTGGLIVGFTEEFN